MAGGSGRGGRIYNVRVCVFIRRRFFIPRYDVIIILERFFFFHFFLRAPLQKSKPLRPPRSYTTIQYDPWTYYATRALKTPHSMCPRPPSGQGKSRIPLEGIYGTNESPDFERDILVGRCRGDTNLSDCTRTSFTVSQDTRKWGPRNMFTCRIRGLRR